jgi:hypothetical protein
VFDAFLTPWTLLIKALGLALAVASGLSLGKEVNDPSYSRVIFVFDIYVRVPSSMWPVACHTCFPKFSRNSEQMKVLTLFFATIHFPDNNNSSKEEAFGRSRSCWSLCSFR